VFKPVAPSRYLLSYLSAIDRTGKSYFTKVTDSKWWGNLREGDHWGDPDIDGRIILRRIFGKWDVGVWTGLGWLRIGTGGGRL
jgi:hypothetical protein